MDKLELMFHLNNCIFDIGNGLLRILRFPRELRSRDTRNKNSELKNYKKSDRCYIVGLGPSLKDVNFSKLDGDIIATNRYYRFDKDVMYSPTYYCIFDKAFFVGTEKEEFENMVNQYPDTCFVLNGIYKDAIENLLIDKSETKRYYGYMWNGALNHTKKIDYTKILPIANNIVHNAIMLAIFCEYKEIVLLGCDFNSFASQKAVHCYTESDNSRRWSLDFELYCYSLVANAHIEMEKIAKKLGIKIINSTKGSLIDAYEFDEDMISQLYIN